MDLNINKPKLIKNIQEITPALSVVGSIISGPLGGIVTNLSALLVNHLNKDINNDINNENSNDIIKKFIETVAIANKIDILNSIIKDYLLKLNNISNTYKYEEYISFIFIDLKKKDTLGNMCNLILEFKEWITMFLDIYKILFFILILN